MSNNLYTLLKSLAVTIVLLIALLLPLIPALTFHFTMMWLIGDDNWETWGGWSNIVTVTIAFVGCYYVAKPGAFTYKVLRYIENY